ncbi:PIG-L family deacetylase [bacterium]|nr:PIG-L family deacetylase [bacterium]
MEDSFNKIFDGAKTVICVFAHPDDTELYAGGTIARLIQAGIKVVSVKMTLGNKGSRDELIPEDQLRHLRKDEDLASMKVLGVSENNSIYLDLGDGSVEYTVDNISKLARIFRKYQPDVLVTHNPEDKIIRFEQGINWVNHRDHQNTGLLAIDAAYPYSRDRNFFPEQLNNVVKPAKCTKLLLVDYYNHLDTLGIEVTDFLETRIQAHAKHSSQYSVEQATDSANFFTDFLKNGKKYERFRYIEVD